MLEIGAQGSYIELSSKENPNGLAIVYVPGIEPMLERAKELKGKPLSESEKERIKNNAPAVAMPKEVAAATIEQRGYE